jgi:hypothetical protein
MAPYPLTNMAANSCFWLIDFAKSSPLKPQGQNKAKFYRKHLWKVVYTISSFTFLHIPRRHLRKMKSWTIIGLFYIPLEFQPKMKNWIYHHSTGFLKYTNVLSNSAILLVLPNAPRNLFPNY